MHVNTFNREQTSTPPACTLFADTRTSFITATRYLNRSIHRPGNNTVHHIESKLTIAGWQGMAYQTLYQRGHAAEICTGDITTPIIWSTNNPACEARFAGNEH